MAEDTGNNEDTGKSKFPIDFSACPICGSTRTMAGTIVEQEKERGKMGEDIHAFVFQHKSFFMDSRRTTLSVPILSTFYDVCLDCGTPYCIHAELATGAPQAMPRGGPKGFIPKGYG